ncbi:hypothetical protein BCU41_024680 (plasmid) [Vibrio lentus]|uniref:hypothetical protein n=1 Tax=Vibrio lentus TaxID=136468 RepID=UPI00105699ED
MFNSVGLTTDDQNTKTLQEFIMLKAITALKFDPKQGAQEQTLFIEQLINTLTLSLIANFVQSISCISLFAIACNRKRCLVVGGAL